MSDCPQWRLRTAHYLNSPGTEYIQTEVSRDTGRQNRRTFPVPRLISPENPNDCDRNGDCVVYHSVEGAKAPRHGIEFLGDPTPEMEPLNDEAQVISDTFAEKWAKPFTAFELKGEVSELYFENLTAAINKAIEKGGGRVAEPNQPVVSVAEFNALKAQLAELQAKQSERRV
jgi:hypothetical protein